MHMWPLAYCPLGWDNSLLWAAVPCLVGCLAVSLTSTHWMPVESPSAETTTKRLQTLPNVPWGAKLPLIENH